MNKDDQINKDDHVMSSDFMWFLVIYFRDTEFGKWAVNTCDMYLIMCGYPKKPKLVIVVKTIANAMLTQEDLWLLLTKMHPDC